MLSLAAGIGRTEIGGTKHDEQTNRYGVLDVSGVLKADSGEHVGNGIDDPVAVPSGLGHEVGSGLPAPAREGEAVGAGAAVAVDVRALICAQLWNCTEALAIAWCESRLVATARDPEGASHGLFQIHESSWRRYFGEAKWSRVYEPEENVAMAVEIWERAGRTWLPWSCKAT